MLLGRDGSQTRMEGGGVTLCQEGGGVTLCQIARCQAGQTRVRSGRWRMEVRVSIAASAQGTSKVKQVN